MIAEVALSCALLVGAGLMTKSITNLSRVQYPFETDGLFTARVSLEAGYPDPEARRRLWDDLVGELRSIRGGGRGEPDVGATARRREPTTDSHRRCRLRDADVLPSLNRVVVTPGYFAALGSAPTAGRDFTPADGADSELVAIVNQPMVDRYFEGRNPVGRRFREGHADTLPRRTVVGVVPDLGLGGPRIDALGGFEPAGYYVPLRQADAWFMNIAALPRVSDPLTLTPDVREAVRRADPELPIYNILTQAEVIDRHLWFFSVFGFLFIVFGLVALLIAWVGLYGVLSFAVSRRTQEMGIRMALGAEAEDVVRLVAGQGARQLAVGVAVGLALAFGVTRVIAFLLYDVDAQDPMVFSDVLVTVLLVGMLAAVVPARRATSVDPVEALRHE